MGSGEAGLPGVGRDRGAGRGGRGRRGYAVAVD